MRNKRSDSDEEPSKKKKKIEYDDRQIPIQQPGTSYSKRSELTGTVPGILYQLELSMLFIKNGAEKGDSFYLYSELKGVGEFDDLIFQHKVTSSAGQENYQYHFLQAKHITYKKIKVNELLKGVQDDKNEFGLAKYFVSSLKIKHNPQFQDGELKDLTIFTNTNLDFKAGTLELTPPTKGRGKGKTFSFKELGSTYPTLNYCGNLYQFADKTEALKELKSIFKNALEGEIKDLREKIGKEDKILKEKELKLKNLLGEALKFEEKRKLDTAKEEELTSKEKKLKLDIERLKKEFKEKNVLLNGLESEQSTDLASSINDFLDKLVFAVNQLPQSDLEETIKNKIMREEFTEAEAKLIYAYVQKEFIDWLKQKEGRPLSKEDDFAKKGVQIIARVVLDVQTLIYRHNIRKFNLDFEQKTREVIESGVKVLVDSNKKIFNIVAQQEAWLSSIKLNCILDKNKQKIGDYAFSDLESLLGLQLQRESVSTAFEFEKLNLIAIEEDIEPNEIRVQNLFIKLFITLKNNPNKKIVLITRKRDSLSNLLETLKNNLSSVNYLNDWEKNSLLSFLNDLIRDNNQANQGRQYITESEDESKFSDFDTKSREMLLEIKVTFQGKEVPLYKLVGVENSNHLSKESLNKLDEIISGLALVELIQEDKIEVGSLPPRLPEDERHYYIGRAFNKIKIKADFEHDNKFFLIRDVTTYTKSTQNLKAEHENVFIDNAEERFKHLCQKYPEYVIHWLKKENDQLIWQQSQGSVSMLRVYLDSDEENISSYEKDELPKYMGKVAIIADKPGMGKSTLLTRLFEEQVSESKWFIRVNLEEQKEQLKKLVDNHVKFIEIENTVEFLSAIDTHCIRTDLAKKLLQYYLSNGDIILSFDSFNEIKFQYQEKVVQLIKFLKDKTKAERIWVATRSHRRDYLEKAVDTFAYALKPLDDVEKIEFLKRFWTQDLSLDGKKVENIRQLYISIVDNVKQVGAGFDGKIGEDGNQDLINTNPEIFESVASKLRKVVGLIGNLKETNKLVNKLERNEDLVNSLKQVRDLAEKISEIVNLVMKSNDSILNEEKISNRINDYAKELVVYFSSIIHETEKSHFVGVPLQVRMIAEAFLIQFKEFFWFDQGRPDMSVGPDINILDLYQLFVQQKYNIYFEQKVLFGDFPPFLRVSSIREFTKAHRRLAVNVLFPEEEELLLLGGAETIPFKHEELREHGEEELKQVGIVQGTKTKLNFIHRTFAEYFVADLLDDKLSKKRSNPTVYNDAIVFLKRRLLEEENDVMRRFLDWRLIKGHEMHRAVLRRDEEKFNILLSNNANYPCDTDKLGRIPLYLAAAYGHERMFKSLIQDDQSKESLTVCDDLGLGLLSYVLLLRKRAVYIFELAWREAGAQREAMLSAGNYAVFREAVRRRDIYVVSMIFQEPLFSEQKATLVKALEMDSYAVFKEIVQRGDFQMVDVILTKASSEQKADLLKALSGDNYAILKEFLCQPDLEERQGGLGKSLTFDVVWKHTPTDQKRDIMKAFGADYRTLSVNNYEIFKQIVQYGEVKKVEVILKEARDEEKAALMKALLDDDMVFKRIMWQGNCMVWVILEQAPDEEKAALVKALLDDDMVFKEIVQQGKAGIVEVILQWAPDEAKAGSVEALLKVMEENDCKVFRLAVQHKNTTMVQIVLEQKQVPADRKSVLIKTLSTGNYKIFKEIVESGNPYDCKMVKVILKEARDEEKAALMKALLDNEMVFKRIVWQGKDWMVRVILEKAPDEDKATLVKALQEGDMVFKEIVQKGNAEIVEVILQWAPDEEKVALVETFSTNNYALLNEIVRKGDFHKSYIDIVKIIFKQVPSKQQAIANAMIKIIKEDNYVVFEKIVQWEFTYVVKVILEQAPVEEKVALVNALIEGKAVFKGIVQKGNAEMVGVILQWASENKKVALVKALLDDDMIFKEIVQKGNTEMVKVILQWAPDEEKVALVKIFSMDNYALLKEIVRKSDFHKGYIDIVKVIFKQVPSKQQAIVNAMIKIIKEDNYVVFEKTVQGGFACMVKVILEQAPVKEKPALVDVMMKVMEENDHEIFRKMVIMRIVGMVQLVFEHTTSNEQKVALVQALVKNTSALKQGVIKPCSLGYPQMFELILAQTPLEQKSSLMKVIVEVIKADKYVLFESIVRRGLAHVIEVILKEAPVDQKPDLVGALERVTVENNYAMFKKIVERENADMVRVILEQVSDDKKVALLSLGKSVVGEQKWQALLERIQYN